MNCIVLEGELLYIMVGLFILSAVMSFISVIGYIVSDSRYEEVKKQEGDDRQKILLLQKENFRLRLKCGELEVNENSNTQMR